MKVCPKCNQQYDDENLNFCLNDGELLMEQSGGAPGADADATPTVFLDQPRVTNQNLPNDAGAGFGNAPNVGQPTQQDQAIFQQEFNAPQQFPVRPSLDKTLPTISLITGSLGLLLFCCYLGFPFGAAALVTGYLGLSNAKSDPTKYGGKELAVIGMVLGGIAFAINVLFVIFAILSNFFK